MFSVGSSGRFFASCRVRSAIAASLGTCASLLTAAEATSALTTALFSALADCGSASCSVTSFDFCGADSATRIASNSSGCSASRKVVWKSSGTTAYSRNLLTPLTCNSSSNPTKGSVKGLLESTNTKCLLPSLTTLIFSLRMNSVRSLSASRKAASEASLTSSELISSLLKS